MKMIWKCLFSPRLYKIYKEGPAEEMYKCEGLEKWGDKVLSTTNTLFNIALYTSPFIGLYVWYNGVSADQNRFLLRAAGGLGVLVGVCCVLRALGRSLNPRYCAFVDALTLTTHKREGLEALRRYDFDYNYWPVTFIVGPDNKMPWCSQHPFNTCANANLPPAQRFAIQLLAYIATHTFGLRLIYPGSLSVIKYCLSSALFHGRAELVEKYDGQRTKIQTADKNTIDTMLVDNRQSDTGGRGSLLVVCCEGNSGFYEIGIMTTPAKAGYSVLGWNHPGFGGSSGRPFPSQEHNAIDAVMRYAISLGFGPERIIMYGWSIGGYTAAWAAGAYKTRGLLLDATFDDLLPLALNQMPNSWSLLVREVIRSYVDLNVAKLVEKYTGPVQLVRRTEDEIICLRAGQMSTNRGNNLLIRVVESRHSELPALIREELRRLVACPETERVALLYTSEDENELTAIKLISNYMRDFKSSHCAPLTEKYFEGSMVALEKLHRQRKH